MFIKIESSLESGARISGWPRTGDKARVEAKSPLNTTERDTTSVETANRRWEYSSSQLRLRTEPKAIDYAWGVWF